MGWIQKVKNVLLTGAAHKKEYKETLQEICEKWDRNIDTQLRAKYTYFFEKESIRKNCILYEAYSGRGMVGNPYSVFRYLFLKKGFEDYIHVWAIEDMEDNRQVIEEYAQYSQVVFVEYQSIEYARYLASAEYLINDSTFMDYFIKRKEQVYINTWHGIPLKTLGYDEPQGNIGAANIVRNFLAADYLISPNKFMTEVYKKSFKLEGLFEGTILQAGQPRNDAHFYAEKKKVIETLDKHGVIVDPNKKVILYAPTWKGEKFGSPETGLESYFKMIRCLEKNMNMDEYQVLVKPHQIVYKHIKNSSELTGQFVPAIIDTNELLSIVDVLISDYSSIYFDFLVTEKPILFFIEDLEEYMESRGLYFGLDKLPGPIVRNYDELGRIVNDIDQAMKPHWEKYQIEKQWACGNDDGHVCQRIAEAVFEKKENGICIKCDTKIKKKLLFRGGSFVTNGLTFSLMTLLGYIDYSKYDVTVSVGPTKNKEAIETIKAIRPEVRVLYWNGKHNAMNLEEEALFALNMKHGLDAGWDAPKDICRRELGRLFGKSRFDYAIEYTGYSKFYAILFSFFEDAKKLIWMHNDLKEELGRGEKGGSDVGVALRPCISTYPYMDKLVGCSELTMQVNKENFATERTKDKFTYVRNMVNLERILGEGQSLTIFSTEKTTYYVADIQENFSMAYEAEVVYAPEKQHVNFVTMGRLSPEKNQDSLIKAFGKLYRENPSVRLYILGEGLWREYLEELIEKEKLKGIVHLVGILMKPFGFLKGCDCFILPSHYEGQPLVVQEARTLHMPIIISKFATAKDVLIENGQLLIGHEVDDLYEGMKTFIEGGVPDYEFDCEAYNKEVYKEFEHVLQCDGRSNG